MASTNNPHFQDAVLRIARGMAASGEYAAAHVLLDVSSTADSTPPVELLLLRAKMFAQQRRFEDAIAGFNRVLETQPDHSEARLGLRLAEQLRTRPNIWMYLTSRVAGIATALVTLALVGILWAMSRTHAVPQDTVVLGVVENIQREQEIWRRDEVAAILQMQRRLAVLEQKADAANATQARESLRLRRHISTELERLRLDVIKGELDVHRRHDESLR